MNFENCSLYVAHKGSHWGEHSEEKSLVMCYLMNGSAPPLKIQETGALKVKKKYKYLEIWVNGGTTKYLGNTRTTFTTKGTFGHSEARTIMEPQ